MLGLCGTQPLTCNFCEIGDARGLNSKAPLLPCEPARAPPSLTEAMPAYNPLIPLRKNAAMGAHIPGNDKFGISRTERVNRALRHATPGLGYNAPKAEIPVPDSHIDPPLRLNIGGGAEVDVGRNGVMFRVRGEF